ncbi:MAG TPA: protein kinase [Candidatus Eisenbacteria bacterium]|nr:protein kinase [Candidatus Eisenbacteria bacterium]
MSLAPGTRLGVYEIVGPLGAGGMGEVFRARDTRLGREVAIKVLPQDLAATPEVRARFEREAQVISSLNHPNICTLHDVGHQGGIDYLVLELVEGESLADRVQRGPLPLVDLLRIGVQVADALDKAHRAGIVHRDLKPGNVMLAKSGAKLLDFGLARGSVLGEAPGGAAHSPTMSRPLTAQGTILGTFQYMAPEQLEGRDADARTDIWALGCVLYEMATGKRAFEGKSQASLISAIMSQEPVAIPQLAPLTPPALERLVKACLAKDPDDRIQTAHDVKLQLQWVAEGGSQLGVAAPVAARRRARERGAWALAAVATLAAVTLAAIQFRPKPPRDSVTFELTPPAGIAQIDLPRISPDGSCLAFNATDSLGVTSIWVRPMNTLEARRLAGTEQATRPFWSPDSRYLAYFSGGKLYKIDTVGGPPFPLCDAPTGADGSWSRRGVIIFDGGTRDSIRMVSSAGGESKGAVRLDRANGETFAAWPQFLPDGRHFLYVAYRGSGGVRTLMVGAIDSKETKAIGPAASRAEYASGHLLFVRAGTLLAQNFDAGALKVTGEPFPVAQGVAFDELGSARFSAASNGTLVYRTGSGADLSRLAWVNRKGEIEGTLGTPADFDSPKLSRDGKLLAVAQRERPGVARTLWVWDLERGIGSEFASPGQTSADGLWSPDGRRLAYVSNREGHVDLLIKPIDGGPDSVVLTSPDWMVPCSWSSDGRWIFLMKRTSEGKGTFDVAAVPIGGAAGESAKPATVVATPQDDVHPAISPDGKSLVYVSVESDGPQLYMQAFPSGGARWRITQNGGRQPFWRADGRELFYLALDRSIMSVTVEPGSPPRLGRPVRLFYAPLIARQLTRALYAPTPDGQRFLVIAPLERSRVGSTTVVLDWLARHDKD